MKTCEFKPQKLCSNPTKPVYGRKSEGFRI